LLEIFTDIKSEMECVEEELIKNVGDADPLIKDPSVHMINAGGKRMRPAFCFLGGKYYNYNPKKILPLAVAIEMTHMATLIHDDVVDSSLTRRNIPTVNAVWGNKVSTHLGDYLVGKSIKLLIEAGYDILIIKMLTDISIKMCEGELQQLKFTNNDNQTVRDYFYRIKKKTANLISVSCHIGAAACGAPSQILMRLKKYGHCIGMAFQITDDILDLTADQDKLGKPVGSDLKQGILTLPLIYALRESPRKIWLAEVLCKEIKSQDEINEACRLIVQCGGVDYAANLARKYIQKARGYLKKLPQIPAGESLSTVAEFIGSRKF